MNDFAKSLQTKADELEGRLINFAVRIIKLSAREYREHCFNKRLHAEKALQFG
jgi:hypothetical protein